MKIVLVDTSVWINYLKNIDSETSKYLTRESDKTLFATCPVIVQEVLQGIRSDKDHQITEKYFLDLIQLVEDPYELALEAAQLYRMLRKNGITIRKPNDCLIASYAIKNNVELLQNDRDFLFIAKNSALKLVAL